MRVWWCAGWTVHRGVWCCEGVAARGPVVEVHRNRALGSHQDFLRDACAELLRVQGTSTLSCRGSTPLACVSSTTTRRNSMDALKHTDDLFDSDPSTRCYPSGVPFHTDGECAAILERMFSSTSSAEWLMGAEHSQSVTPLLTESADTLFPIRYCRSVSTDNVPTSQLFPWPGVFGLSTEFTLYIVDAADDRSEGSRPAGALQSGPRGRVVFAVACCTPSSKTSEQESAPAADQCNGKTRVVVDTRCTTGLEWFSLCRLKTGTPACVASHHFMLTDGMYTSTFIELNAVPYAGNVFTLADVQKYTQLVENGPRARLAAAHTCASKPKFTGHGIQLWTKWALQLEALLNRSSECCYTQFAANGRALRYASVFSTVRVSLERVQIEHGKKIGCGSCVQSPSPRGFAVPSTPPAERTSNPLEQSSMPQPSTFLQREPAKEEREKQQDNTPKRARMSHRDRVSHVEALLRQNSSREETICHAGGSYAIVEGSMRGGDGSVVFQERGRKRSRADDSERNTSEPNQVDSEVAPHPSDDGANVGQSALRPSATRSTPPQIPSGMQSGNELSKRFKCHECGSRFSRKYDMQRHVRSVHLGERNYPCELCDMAFQQAGHLEAHVNVVHLNVRRFICAECGCRFGNSSNLRSHITYMHSRRATTDDPRRLCSDEQGQ